MRKIFLAVLFYLVFISCSLYGQIKAVGDLDVVRLELGKSIQMEMKGNDIQKYILHLEPNQFLYGWVEQQGKDIIVKIFDMTGKKVIEIDAPTGDIGYENILMVNEPGGDYIVEIHPFDPLSKSGNYTIKIEILEKAATIPTEKIDQMLTPWDKTGAQGAAIVVM